MSIKNAKLIGVLGSVLFLSFSVLFLIFGQEHWSILALAVVCMALSWKFSEQEGSKIYYLVDSGINLKLPESTICLPSRRGNCLVFLLKNGFFFLWKDGQELEGKSPYIFEPVSPVLLNKGFVCWAKGRIVWFSYDGDLIGDFPIKAQGLSLIDSIGESLLFGTTMNALYLWDNYESEPILTEVFGIPLTFDRERKCLFTSTGAFYDLSESRRPILLDEIKREVLGAYRLGNHAVYFDDKGQIFSKHVNGSEIFLDYYNRDYFYPHKSSQRVVYVNRDRQCCILQIKDTDVHQSSISELSAVPAWLRWFDSHLMIYEETNSSENLIKISADGDVSSVPTNGLFVPLGIDEGRGVFHYSCDNVWFEWEFSDETPREVKMDCPEQILFYEGSGYKKVGENWYTLDDQLLSQLNAASHDENYSHQKIGLIPYLI